MILTRWPRGWGHRQMGFLTAISSRASPYPVSPRQHFSLPTPLSPKGAGSAGGIVDFRARRQLVQFHRHRAVMVGAISGIWVYAFVNSTCSSPETFSDWQVMGDFHHPSTTSSFTLLIVLLANDKRSAFLGNRKVPWMDVGDPVAVVTTGASPPPGKPLNSRTSAPTIPPGAFIDVTMTGWIEDNKRWALPAGACAWAR